MSLVAAATLLVPTAPSAQEPPPCGPTEQINNTLFEKHGETLYDSFLFGTVVYQLWLSPRHRTGSVVRRAPNGSSCVVLGITDITDDMIERVDIISIQAVPPGHPPPGAFDPYSGYQDGRGVSCCGGKDCAPAPYRDGLLQLPNGVWVDPREEPDVSIYFSFDGQGHACVRTGRLRCAFIPGEGV